MASSVIITPTLSEVPTLLNGFNTQFSLPITVWKRGDICLITGAVTRASNPALGTVICNLSSQFRPLSRVVYMTVIGSAARNRIDIAPNGDVIYIEGSANDYLTFTTTYLIV